MGGYFLEHANFVAADPLKTPVHIAPVWYFTPFYAILRAVPDKFFGVVGMGAASWCCSPALARPKPGEVHPLPGAVVQDRPRDLRGELPRARLAGYPAGHARVDQPGPRLLGPVFRLFPADAWYTSIDKTLPVPERVTSK